MIHLHQSRAILHHDFFADFVLLGQNQNSSYNTTMASTALQFS